MAGTGRRTVPGRVALGVALVAGACGTGGYDEGRRTTVVRERPVYVAEAPPCDDAGACGEAYAVGGRLYEPVEGVCSPDLPMRDAPLVAVAPRLPYDRFRDIGHDRLRARRAEPADDCRWQELRLLDR